VKVLVISHMYPSTSNEVAGIFVHEHVKALVAQGVEARVISPVPWVPFPIKFLREKWKGYSEIPEKTVWEGIQVWYPRYPVLPKAWLFSSSGKRMYLGIKKSVEKIYQEFPFDLIHAHVALPDGYAGMLLAQKYKKPLIVTIHGQDLQRTVFRGAAYKQALREVFAAAHKVIVVSEKLKRVAEEQFDMDKAIVVHNGVSLEKILRDDQVFIYKQGKRVLLSVSNLIQTKGIDLNIRAVSRLINKYPNLHYIVVGSGPLKTALLQLSYKLGLANKVKFIGRVSHQDVMKYMAGCEVFVLPSWQEGFGVVYIEAMAHGKPVIACRGEGPEDFIEHGRTGLLVEPQDVDSLVEALDFLLSHPKEAKAMGKRAQEVVLRYYTWEGNAAKTIEIYKEVLHGR